MALVVHGVARVLPELVAPLELAMLVSAGAVTYFAILFALRREMLAEIVELVVRRREATSPAA